MLSISKFLEKCCIVTRHVITSNRAVLQEYIKFLNIQMRSEPFQKTFKSILWIHMKEKYSDLSRRN